MLEQERLWGKDWQLNIIIDGAQWSAIDLDFHMKHYIAHLIPSQIVLPIMVLWEGESTTGSLVAEEILVFPDLVEPL